MGVSEKALSGGATPFVTGAAVSEYIPQREPMVMVSSFDGMDGGVSHSSFTVVADNIFVADGTLDECALIENMAQSAALRVGYLCVSAALPVPLGFIGAVDRCEILRRARVGETLGTTIKIVAEIAGVTLAEAEVKVADERICSCRLKIFLEQSPE